MTGGKRRKHVIATIAAAAFTAALSLETRPAGAGTEGVTGEEVLAALRNAGIRARLGTDILDDPQIDASARGTDFQVLFYGCGGGVCDSFMFRSQYIIFGDPTLEEINEWNADSIHARAYLDFAADAIVELGTFAGNGIDDAQILGAVEVWLDAVGDFEDTFDLSNASAKVGGAAASAGRAEAGSGASIEVCNESGAGVSVAKAAATDETDSSGSTLFRSEGWWNLDYGECIDLWDAPFENRYYYVHASADDGHYGGEYYFCTLDEEFTIVDTQCSADFIRKAFFQIDMAEGNRMESGYTVTLDP